MTDVLPLGAHYLDRRCWFVVWAPRAERVEVRLVGDGDGTDDRHIPLRQSERGYHVGELDAVRHGQRYLYRFDGKELPDPASRSQPAGVHGPSAVVATDFPWTDAAWRGVPIERCVFYELHVGTFTATGTFDAVIPHLDYLRDLGVTVVELMPVAQFPGTRNWGYDGAFPYAVQDSYGGVDGLRRLVNACHEAGLAVALDVVYNHLGPEGNYLDPYGPYFTDRYRTPWGAALNFDGPGSDEVRRFFVENALWWVRDCHVDALRLDAVHAILDTSPYPFLQELADAVHDFGAASGREVLVIPESPSNDARLITATDRGGFGFDAQWSDDFHHCLHTLLTGERHGYYEDYGELAQLAKAYRQGFVYSGQYSRYHQRRHGTSSADIPAHRFVVASQNHDQVGNRMSGDRLGSLVSFEALKLAAAATLLAPFVPLLFMGEEYGEPAPFPYFVSHTDPALVEAVRKGRRREFAAFGWQGEPPDPQAEETFRSATLDHALRNTGRHAVLLDYYRELLRLRRDLPSLARLSKEGTVVHERHEEGAIVIERRGPSETTALVLHFGTQETSLPLTASEEWQLIFDSADGRWSGPGSLIATERPVDAGTPLSLRPLSAVLLRRAVVP